MASDKSTSTTTTTTKTVNEGEISAKDSKEWIERARGMGGGGNNSKCLFPWRHDTNRLPRLDSGEIFGPGIPRMPWWLEQVIIQSSASTLETQIGPWYQRLATDRQWKQELADSTSWAFGQAVSKLVTSPPSTSSKNKGDNSSDGSGREECKTDDTKLDGESNESDSPVISLDDMLEKRLFDLYQSATSTKDSTFEVRLQCEPQSAEFISLLWVPFLTREAVGKTPALRHTLRNVRRALQRQEQLRGGRALSTMEAMPILMREVQNLADSRLVEHSNHATLDSTLVCQVLVHCKETFWVKERETGQVIQGTDQAVAASIPHLVRMEMVITSILPNTAARPTRTETHQWVITDWDDLLDGNREWYDSL